MRLRIRSLTEMRTLAEVIAGHFIGARVVETDGVQVVGSVPITFSDFDVEAPSLGFVTVDDAGSVEFGLDLVRSAGS